MSFSPVSFSPQKNIDCDVSCFYPNLQDSPISDFNLSVCGEEDIKDIPTNALSDGNHQNKKEVQPFYTKDNSELFEMEGNEFSFSNSFQENTENIDFFKTEENEDSFSYKNSPKMPEEKNDSGKVKKFLGSEKIQIHEKDNRILLKKVDNEDLSALPSFERVCKALQLIFEGKFGDHAFIVLKSYERNLISLIVNYIFKRIFTKYKNGRFPNHNALVEKGRKLLKEGDLVGVSQEIFTSDFVCVKRKEEKLKFVWKNATSFFRRQFFEEKKLKLNDDNEILFLNHFFVEHVKELKQDATVFSDPLSNIRYENKKFKSLNKKYIKTIFSLTKFKERFFESLNSDFKVFYRRSVLKKIKILLHSLGHRLEGALRKEEEGLYKRFIREFGKELGKKKSASIRFPWFDKEIDDATLTFKKQVERLSG